MTVAEVLIRVASALAKAATALLPLVPFYARGTSARHPLSYRTRFHRYARGVLLAVFALFLVREAALFFVPLPGEGGIKVSVADASELVAGFTGGSISTPAGALREWIAAPDFPDAVKRAWAILSASVLAACAGGAATWLGCLVAQTVTLARIRSSADLLQSRDGYEAVWSRRVGAPFSAGVFVPRVYLPGGTDVAGGQWMEAAIAHERAHIAKGHALCAVAESFLGRTLWFHPFARLLQARGSLLRELECDEAVIASGFHPRPYGEAILAFAERSPIRGGSLLVAARLGRTSGLEERIRSIGRAKTCRETNRLLPSLALPAVICAALSAAILCYGGPLGTEWSTDADEAVAGQGGGRSTLPLAWPVGAPSRVSLPFGPAVNPLSGADFFHAAVDIAAREGSPVLAAAAGRVSRVGNEPDGLGLYLVIEHSAGLTGVYAHCASISVETGEKVAAGQEVGRVGATGRTTGPHLHLAVHEMGTPVDPLGFLTGLEKAR